MNENQKKKKILDKKMKKNCFAVAIASSLFALQLMADVTGPWTELEMPAQGYWNRQYYEDVNLELHQATSLALSCTCLSEPCRWAWLMRSSD